jgi:hypothetical protein
MLLKFLNLFPLSNSKAASTFLGVYYSSVLLFQYKSVLVSYCCHTTNDHKLGYFKKIILIMLIILTVLEVRVWY